MQAEVKPRATETAESEQLKRQVVEAPWPDAGAGRTALPVQHAASMTTDRD